MDLDWSKRLRPGSDGAPPVSAGGAIACCSPVLSSSAAAPPSVVTFGGASIAVPAPSVRQHSVDTRASTPLLSAAEATRIDSEDADFLLSPSASSAVGAPASVPQLGEPRLRSSVSRVWTEQGAVEEERAYELVHVCIDGRSIVVDMPVSPPVPRRAAHNFNQKPVLTVRALMEPGSVSGADFAPSGGGLSADEVARWLLTCKRLSTNRIGDYLGRPDAGPVLLALVARLDLRSLPLDEALRFFLSLFRLPGEAQQIARVIETFAARYAACHAAGALSRADTVYVLCYSLIMLNVDAHSPRIPEAAKMTPDQFVSNNRGIDDGSDLPRELLEQLYSSVVAREVKIEQREFIESSAQGWLLKHGGRGGCCGVCCAWRTARRYFILSNSVLYYFNAPDDALPLGLVPLEDIAAAPVRGPCCGLRPSSTFRLAPARGGKWMKSLKASAGATGGFELGHHSDFVLHAPSPELMEEWVSAIDEAAVSSVVVVGGGGGPGARGSVGRRGAFRRLLPCLSPCLEAAAQRQGRPGEAQIEAARTRGWSGLGAESMRTRSPADGSRAVLSPAGAKPSDAPSFKAPPAVVAAVGERESAKYRVLRDLV